MDLDERQSTTYTDSSDGQTDGRDGRPRTCPRIDEAAPEADCQESCPSTMGKTVAAYAEADGTVWLFRCQIPAHRGMVGEIVQAPIGRRIRVHCWSAARPGEYSEPAELIARKFSTDASTS